MRIEDLSVTEFVQQTAAEIVYLYNDGTPAFDLTDIEHAFQGAGIDPGMTMKELRRRLAIAERALTLGRQNEGELTP